MGKALPSISYGGERIRTAILPRARRALSRLELHPQTASVRVYPEPALTPTLSYSREREQRGGELACPTLLHDGERKLEVIRSFGFRLPA